MFTLCMQPFREVDVTYQIEFPDPACSNATAPDTVVVSVRRGNTALNVMEQAVTDFGTPYRFSATYFGDELGYFIDSISSTESRSADNCFWFYFIRDPTGNEFLSPVGVSNFCVPSNGFSIIWRFMDYYTLFCEGSNC